MSEREEEQLDLEAAIAETVEGFDGWDIFDPGGRSAIEEAKERNDPGSRFSLPEVPGES